MYLNCVFNIEAILAAILDKFHIRNANVIFGRHVLTNNLLTYCGFKNICHYSDPFPPSGGHLKPVDLTKLIFKQKMNNILKKSGSLNDALVLAPMN